MLESRESSEVSTWLAGFPNIQVVSRDGSMMYAKAISTAHPDATQISDRFHIFKGLTDAARQYVLSIVGQRIAVPSDTSPSSYWQKQPRTETDLPERLHNATTAKRAEAVQKVRELADTGLNITQISEVAGHCYTTIKNYLNPDYDPAFPEYGVNYPSKLKPYCDTIDAMLNERKKFREIEEKIRDMGYRGSASTIRMYATRKRRHNQAAMDEYRRNTEIIERKYLLKLLYIPIEKIKGFTQQQLDKVLTLHPQLLMVYDLIRDFKAIFAAHHADDLEQWLESAKILGSADINSFVNGIAHDINAVRNAIIYPYSNGLAEGSVNKIKRIKHTMYGKASFTTLRTKVLLGEKWRRIN
jgi:transposase